MIPCPAQSRLWRPSANPCPALSQLWRPSANSCPALSFEHMLCSEPANVSDSELPVSVKEYTPELYTMNSETVNAPPVLSVSALPVLSVSALPRSRSLPWFTAQSASLCWSSVRSAPPRWLSAQVWWPSAPPWGSSALPWRTSAPPWWAPVPSAPPWWAPVPSAPPWWAPGPSAPPWWAPGPSALPWWAPVPSSPPWLPALPTLPRSTATPLPRGPGPLSLPLFRLRSTALLDYIGVSGSRSLGGAMSRILSMHFRSFTTRGHSLTTLTLALHKLLHTISKYNSHHPLALTSHS